VKRGCRKHPSESAQGVCVGCRSALCRICVVEPFGDRGAALCVPCALEVGGVRPGRARGVEPRRRRPIRAG
jgi:hypothetical protein